MNLDAPRAPSGGQVVESASRALDAEGLELEALRYRIESRRRQHAEGFSSEAQADDHLDVMNYNHRQAVLRTRIVDYNAKAAELRRAIEQFNELVRRHNALPE